MWTLGLKGLTKPIGDFRVSAYGEGCHATSNLTCLKVRTKVRPSKIFIFLLFSTFLLYLFSTPTGITIPKKKPLSGLKSLNRNFEKTTIYF